MEQATHFWKRRCWTSKPPCGVTRGGSKMRSAYLTVPTTFTWKRAIPTSPAGHASRKESTSFTLVIHGKPWAFFRRVGDCSIPPAIQGFKIPQLLP